MLCFPFGFWGEKQKEENVITYTDTSITEENASARTAHFRAKAVHAGQAQSAGEERGQPCAAPLHVYPWSRFC